MLDQVRGQEWLCFWHVHDVVRRAPLTPLLRCIAVYCGVSQCVAVCRSVLQCVAVCCSVLQCVAVCFKTVASL